MARSATGQVVVRKRQRGTVYGLRFTALGERRYYTLGSSAEGWNEAKAREALDDVLSDVRRGRWIPPAEDPAPAPPRAETLSVYANRWVELRALDGLEPRSVEALQWALGHVLPHLGGRLVSEITTAMVDEYRLAKVRARAHVDRPLGNGSVNKTLSVLAQVLDAAIDDGLLPSNPARGKRRRLKAAKPRRTWLELDELRSILDAAGRHRALLATMALGGLRVGELTALRWSNVDLARGTLKVAKAKTDAGERPVDLSPDLLSELKLHRARSRYDDDRELVFPTSTGRARDRNNVRTRILGRAIERANAVRAEASLPAIQDGVTNHTLRRTFASLLYEAGASPAYVMAQMGHTSSALALEVYARKMERQRDTGARMDALVRGAESAPIGTNGSDEAPAVVLDGDGARLEPAS